MEIDGLTNATECETCCVTGYPPLRSDRALQVSHAILAATTNDSLTEGTHWQQIRKAKHDRRGNIHSLTPARSPSKIP